MSKVLMCFFLVFVTKGMVVAQNSDFSIKEYRDSISNLNCMELKLVTRGVRDAINNSELVNDTLTFLKSNRKMVALSKRLIFCDSVNGEVYYNYGKALYFLEQFKEAKSILTVGLKFQDYRGQNLTLRGFVGFNLEDYEGAKDDFDNAEKMMDKPWPALFIQRAFCKLRKGDNDGAISDYNKAIEIEPDNGGYYYSRGLVYIVMGDIDRGCKDLKIAKSYGYSDGYDRIKEYCN